MKKALLILALVVALILGGLFGADRYMRSRAISELKDDLVAAGVVNPKVELTDWLFLPTVFTSKLSGLNITADSAKENGVTAYRNIRVDAKDVVKKSADSGQVKSVEVDMLLDAGYIKKQIAEEGGSPEDVKLDPATNQLILNHKQENLPVSIALELSPGETTADQPPAIRMTLKKATIAGKDLPADFIPADQRTQTLPLQDAPRGMKITELKIVKGGVKLHLQGKDVLLKDLG